MLAAGTLARPIDIFDLVYHAAPWLLLAVRLARAARAPLRLEPMAKSPVRCPWSEGVSPAYLEYHDREWGVPVHDDRRQFEFLVLEGAQAGLSWSTVLHRREGYRRAFVDFDPVKVARFTPARIEKLLQDPGIIRNRLKVEATVTNARAFLELIAAEGSFDAYIWGFTGGKLSKDMKKRGFRFVGSTILYAHLQATGLVNDHLVSCFRHRECGKLA